MTATIRPLSRETGSFAELEVELRNAVEDAGRPVQRSLDRRPLRDSAPPRSGGDFGGSTLDGSWDKRLRDGAIGRTECSTCTK